LREEEEMTSIVSRGGILLWALAALFGGVSLHAQKAEVILERDGSTIVLEPYAPNIVRVTLSKVKDKATAAPGYGFVGSPSAAGWKHEQDSRGDIYTSTRLVVVVAASQPPKPTANDLQLAKFFDFFTEPRAHITISTPEGKTLLDMLDWSMSAPNDSEGNTEILNDRRPSDEPFYRVGATFTSPADEHYYGLGQNQEGFLDHRGHPVNCWHDYFAPGGESVCVPFLVSNRGYGLVWDNPSKTTIEAGFNERTKWTSQVGDRVSFFLIAGKDTDEIYSGYRQLTGSTPMLPKAAYGFIQSKQRYDSQDEILGVAKGYRDRHLPADVIVVDFLYYTKMGQMDMDPAKWPDPEAMNRQLHAMGYQSLISIWPRFAVGSQYYDMLLQKGWFEHHADGTPTNNDPRDRVGSDIDTTNPDAARWYWETIRDKFVHKGFDSIWLDETEPDLPPDNSYFFIGPGQRYYNVYPLFHTSAVYEGFRRDTQKRVLILARAAYLGAQRNGTIFWSSDIYPTWDTLKRQVPAGLDFTASGLPYWCNDVAGFLNLPEVHHPLHPPLIDPSDARDNVGGYDDYPELYVRWYEYGVFEPIFRTHGTRNYNEIWSYGKQAEPILEKYLRLRYELLPYIYSLGYRTYTTGAPYMRALFMDFPDDPSVAGIGDEYMFGPAFLVAPVTDQGATNRMVYLPAGAVWYNYWTNKRFEGGQTIQVSAPIETIPLFVKAGSIVPLGSAVESTHDKQSIARVRVYSGADGDFTLYNDDGQTYAYEKGDRQITHLHWDDAAQKLTQTGAKAWSGDATPEVVRGR
jgi:alpha-D-xyloside xylohydrolase